MPKLSYGPASQARTLHLLLVLLDFANDELAVAEAEEERLEALRSHIDLHWEGDRHLIVRTKLRYLETLTQLTSNASSDPLPSTSGQPLGCLTKPQIKEALHHLQQLVQWLEDNRTSRRGSEVWHFTIQLGAARRDRPGIIQQFETAWQTHHPRQASAPLPPASSPSSSSFKHNHNWQAICQQALLQRRTDLTTNPLTAQDGLHFKLEDVYVPLAVLPQQPGDDDDETVALSSELLLQKFLPQTTEAKPDPAAIRLALIGEPGAGKTTLLQRLAILLLEQEKSLPVWVSLAELEGRSLEDYLLQDWLQGALRRRSLLPETVDEFVQHIEQGQVWLLLDAVDEMGLASGAALAQISRQLDGWLGHAAVILTCRQNVWESGNNALTVFESYQLLGYGLGHGQGKDKGQEGSAKRLIQRWFRHQPQQAETLWNTLERSEYQQLRSALRNPLRLALLCRTWACSAERNIPESETTAGKLPQSQSLLYNQFVDAFYDWKQSIFPTTLAQRQQLNQTLSQIAVHCLAQAKPRLYFSEAWLQTLSPPIDFAQLETLIQLGWLAPAGYIATAGQRLYRFCHGTFQDYFAAQAIAHPDELLSLTLTTTQGTTTITPLFEAHWQPVILLWLGRAEVAVEHKEQLIQHLVGYPDHCGGLFEQRAQCLAAEALSEFPDFSQAEAILEQVMQWRFNLGGKTPSPLIQQAQRSLAHSHQPSVIILLERYAQNPDLRPFDRQLIAYSLGRSYDPGNAVAIATLTELLQRADYSQHLQINLARALGRVNPGNPLAIATLVQMIQDTPHFNLRKKAALRLARIAPEHPLVLPTFEQLLEQSQEAQVQPTRQVLLNALEAIAPDHPQLRSRETSQEDGSHTTKKQQQSRKQGRKRSQKHGLPLEQMCDRLVQRIQKAQSDSKPVAIRWAIKLGELQPGHPQAVATLLHYLQHFGAQDEVSDRHPESGPETASALDSAATGSDASRSNPVGLLKQIGEGLATIPTEEQIPDLIAPVRSGLEDPIRGSVCQRILWFWSERLGYQAFRAVASDSFENTANTTRDLS